MTIVTWFFFFYSFIGVVDALCMMIDFYYDFSCLFFIACEVTLIDFMKALYMLLRYVPLLPLFDFLMHGSFE